MDDSANTLWLPSQHPFSPLPFLRTPGISFRECFCPFLVVQFGRDEHPPSALGDWFTLTRVSHPWSGMGQWPTAARERGPGASRKETSLFLQEPREETLSLLLDGEDVMSGKAAAIVWKHKHFLNEKSYAGGLTFPRDKVVGAQWKASQGYSLPLFTSQPVPLCRGDHSYLLLMHPSRDFLCIYMQMHLLLIYPPKYSPLCYLFVPPLFLLNDVSWIFLYICTHRAAFNICMEFHYMDIPLLM